jgi:hypothetical protein
MPASIGGSQAIRGDTQTTFPEGGKVVANGEMKTFNALVTGTALGIETPAPAVGFLTQETNVTKTFTGL